MSQPSKHQRRRATRVMTLLASALIASTPPAIAQQDDLKPKIEQLLLQASAGDVQELPQPSRFNPIYWSFPEYARTPYECVGDETAGMYIANLFQQKRGQINLELSSQGFLSATISKQD